MIALKGDKRKAGLLDWVGFFRANQDIVPEG